uniref:Thioester reductase (TE) domain-containing protein n=1 Tax=Thermosporothrix sp. COM3 TaxID=2490863 RepID=A0A455SJW8_9CHLR|nr:hypothetical protein KTC_27870 [Thermosporothrix sp. COM3]
MFHLDIPLRSLFDAPTFADLARHIDLLKLGLTPKPQEGTEYAWYKDAVLDTSIVPDGTLDLEAALAPRAVFLTGATGLLGSALLFDLLCNTKATVYCLVRADSPEQARKKLETKLAPYTALAAVDHSRIVPVIWQSRNSTLA